MTQNSKITGFSETNVTLLEWICIAKKKNNFVIHINVSSTYSQSFIICRICELDDLPSLVMGIPEIKVIKTEANLLPRGHLSRCYIPNKITISHRLGIFTNDLEREQLPLNPAHEMGHKAPFRVVYHERKDDYCITNNACAGSITMIGRTSLTPLTCTHSRASPNVINRRSSSLEILVLYHCIGLCNWRMT